MRGAGILAAVVLAAGCGGGQQRTGTATGETTTVAADAATVAEDPGEQERLAAIAFAMNQLGTGMNACWAKVAAVDFHVHGQMRFAIDVDDNGKTASAALAGDDGTGSPALVACMTDVLTSFRWAPPLFGQSLQLPFAFVAPAMQNVVDRDLVPATSEATGEVATRVLLGEQNTGNATFMMKERRISAGGVQKLPVGRWLEAWVVLEPFSIQASQPSSTPLGVGDVVLVPGDTLVKLLGKGSVGRMVAVAVPEDRPACPAFPTPDERARCAGWRPKDGEVLVIRATSGQVLPRTGATTTLYADPTSARTPGPSVLSVSLLEMDAGIAVPLHTHDHETEVLYVLAGKGMMTIGDTQVPVGPTSVVQIPPGVPHAFRSDEAVRAYQFYTPAGPEQRFKTMVKQ